MGKNLIIVGCGPGSPDYLTAAARKAVESAGVILGARKLLDLFPDSPAARIPLDKDISDTIGKISTYLKTHVVAVLVSGDPGLFSLAKLVTNKYGSDSCHIIPGISSAQVAFARLGLDWSDARMISAHKQFPNINLAVSLEEHKKLAVFVGSNDTGKWVSSFFKNNDYRPTVVICENLTLANEKITFLTVSDLEFFDFSPSSIIVLLDKEMVQ